MPHGHKFDPANREFLVSEEREEVLPAEETLRAFDVQPGWAVADVGCGPGFFSLPLAQLVGSAGTVYAVDMEPKMLESLKGRASEAGVANVVPVESTEDRIPLPDASVDFAFLACVLHELAGLGTLLETRRILRPGGLLGVVDWKKIDQDVGPPIEHRLSAEEAAMILREGGFRPEGPFDATPFHYGFTARKG